MTKYIVVIVGVMGLFTGLFVVDSFTDMINWADLGLYGAGIILAIIGVFAYTNTQNTKPVKKQRNRY